MLMSELRRGSGNCGVHAAGRGCVSVLQRGGWADREGLTVTGRGPWAFSRRQWELSLDEASIGLERDRREM